MHYVGLQRLAKVIISVDYAARPCDVAIVLHACYNSQFDINVRVYSSDHIPSNGWMMMTNNVSTTPLNKLQK
jgi:hypothetical protein